MKRLVGGDFLLDVSSIELEETSTLTNITDKEVISQLTNLKKYIPNPSMIKPIWVKLHDGDGKLVVARGSLSVIDTYEFKLDVILNGYTLKIHVEFTQVLNEDEQPIDDWYIATNDVKYLLTTNNFATFKVADVKNIDDEILSQLKCGDVVIKEDASGEHAYIVSYRGETGICLTYTDASVVETQSYDKIDGVWVYNSEDKAELPINVEDASFKPIYIHPINVANPTMYLGCFIFNNSDDALDTKEKLFAYMRLIQERLGEGNTARFPTTGSFTNGEVQYVAYSIEVPNQTNIKVYGRSTVDGTASSLEISSLTFNCFDGVNKIN